VAWYRRKLFWSLLAGLLFLGTSIADDKTPPKAKRAGLDWWSLQKLTRPALPPVKDTAWLSNPIDAFILAKLEAEALRPAPPADPQTLIRRIYFDLIGLPPTSQEVDDFCQSAIRNPQSAIEDLVDRLLASPHYGERWGRHWLDAARYSESQGYEYDRIRDHAWRYRDYVIQSFNADKPYSQFIKEQIAGDVMVPITSEGIIASSFLVAGPWDQGGYNNKSSVMRLRVREEELEDTVALVGQTFLGLTINCARCHGHKFDPIPQKDYYSFKAGLDGVWHGNRSILPPAAAKLRAAHIDRIKERTLMLRSQILGASLQSYASMLAELTHWQVSLAALPPEPQAYAANSRPPEPAYVLIRGDVEKKGDAVNPGGLSALRTLSPDFNLPADAAEGQRRAKLAEWIASPGNPLTARVMVNRIWHYHFGRGIVATPNDFGFNGDRPTHPELLDWLASEFITSPGEPGALATGGGSLKRLHGLILLSSTYRQSSRLDPQAAAVDVDNRWLWRFPPRRLEGEAVRDAMLAVSGQLNPQMAGPSFRPFTVEVFGSYFYKLTDPGTPEFNRRTVYRINVNSARSPLLESLDCPEPAVKTPKRGLTTTPLQALALMNNSFVQRQARCFAERITREAGSDPAVQVKYAYHLAFGRPLTAQEEKRAVIFAREHGIESLCWALLNANEFLYVK
jgi:hypothetical protein